MSLRGHDSRFSSHRREAPRASNERDVRRQQEQREWGHPAPQMPRNRSPVPPYRDQRRRSRSPARFDEPMYGGRREQPGARYDDQDVSYDYQYDRRYDDSRSSGYSGRDRAPRTPWPAREADRQLYADEQAQSSYYDNYRGPSWDQSSRYADEQPPLDYRRDDRRPIYITPRPSSYRDNNDTSRYVDNGDSRLPDSRPYDDERWRTQQVPPLSTAPSNSSSRGYGSTSESFNRSSKMGRPSRGRRQALLANSTPRTAKEADWMSKHAQLNKSSNGSTPAGKTTDHRNQAVRQMTGSVMPKKDDSKKDGGLKDRAEVSMHPSDDSNKNSSGRSNAGLSKASIERASRMSNKALDEESIEAAATVESEVEHDNDKIEIAGGALVDGLCDILASEGDEPAIEDFTNVSDAKINGSVGADDVEDVDTAMPDASMLDIDSGVVDLTVDEYEPLYESDGDDMGYTQGGKHSTASKPNKFNENAQARVEFQEALARFEDATEQDKFAGPLAKVMSHYLNVALSKAKAESSDNVDWWMTLRTLRGLPYDMSAREWYSLSLPHKSMRDMDLDDILNLWFTDNTIANLVRVGEPLYSSDAYAIDATLMINWIADGDDTQYVIQQMEETIASVEDYEKSAMPKKRCPQKVNKFRNVMPEVPAGVSRFVVPMCSGKHWFVAMLEPAAAKITVYSSLRGQRYAERAQAVLPTFAQLLGMRNQIHMPSQWTFVVGDCTLQRQGYECGAWTVYNIRQLMQMADIEVMPARKSEHTANELRYGFLQELYHRLFDVSIEEDLDLLDSSRKPSGGRGIASSQAARQFDAVAASDKRAVDRMYKQAHEQKWQGLPQPTALVLTRILDKYFGGREEHVTESRTRRGPDGREIQLQRKEILTMLDGRWYGDGIISAIVTSQFLDGTASDVHVIDPFLFNQLVLTTEVRPDLESAVVLSESVQRVLSIMTVNNNHWVAVEADKNTRLIRVWDSLRHYVAREQREYRAGVERNLTRIFDALCNNAIHDVSWTVVGAQWTVQWPTTHKQNNSCDCGAAALENLARRIRGKDVLPWIDLGLCRYRDSVRIEAVLDEALEWGQPDPFDIESIQSPKQDSRHGSLNRPRGAGDLGLSNNLCVGLITQRDVEEALEAAENADLSGVDDILNPPPQYSDKTTYLNAALAIMGDDQQLKMSVILAKFEAFYTRLYHGRPLPKEWRRNMRSALTKRDTMLQYDPGTDIVTKGPGAKKPNSMALTFYGPGMDSVLEHTAGFHDDIDARPDGTVYFVRKSGMPQGKTNLQHRELGACMDAIGDRISRYHWLVHGGRVDEPRLVKDVDAESEDGFENVKWYYKMVRSSTARAMKSDNGEPDQTDEDFKTFVRKVRASATANGRAAHLSLVIAGPDSWTTNFESLGEVLDEFELEGTPSIEFRVTMVMPAQRTENLSHVFKTRGAFSWGHFDLATAVNIGDILTRDGSSLLPWKFPDQYGLQYVLEQVNQRKLDAHGVSTGPEYRDYEEIVDDLTRGLHRNSMPFPEDDKRCCQCDSDQTATAWHRGPDDDTDILCDACKENGDEEMEREKGAGEGLGPQTAPEQDSGPDPVVSSRRGRQKKQTPASKLVDCVEQDEHTQDVASDHGEAAASKSAQKPRRRDFSPKMRTVCNECTRSKLKCNGDPTNPCDLCKFRNVACEFRSKGKPGRKSNKD